MKTYQQTATKILETNVHNKTEKLEATIIVYVTSDCTTTFSPCIWFLKWKTPNTITKQLTIAIILATGLEGFTLRVTSDRKTLKITALWQIRSIDLY